MKRITFILSLVLLVALPSFAGHISPKAAKNAAKSFLDNQGAKTDQLTDLSKAVGLPNLYVFTTEESFVVMAADDCVKPILGYSTTGRFVAENMPENISFWLKNYNDEIQFAIDNKLSAPADIVQQWNNLANGKALTTVIVEPLIQTTWDQNGTWDFDINTFSFILVELYNNLCPYDETAQERTVTGCVATSMAQIMKYWNFPAHGIGSHSYTPSTRPEFGEQFADFGSTYYDWDNMPNQLTTTSSDVEKMAVATLMYHCGVALNMDYNISNNGGSAANSALIPDKLYNHFGYNTSTFLSKSNFSDDDWKNMVKSELNASRPVQYNGSGTGGHAFICDGYDSDGNFHFNWGWSGSNDGYYSLTSLTPGSGGAGGGNYNYTNQQCAVFGIHPSSNNSTPTNLTYIINDDHEITLSWSPASGVSSYNVYRNGICIENTTSTTYSEISPYGTNEYYVRSVNPSNELSFPSNSITVTINYSLPTVKNFAVTLSNDDALLSWTAPEWCYPETESATLTYGGETWYTRWNYVYYGHRYLASDLAQYANKAIYKIRTFIYASGDYTAHIYTNTLNNNPDPDALAAIKTLNYSGNSGWQDIVLDNPVILSGTTDLWVVMKQENTGTSYPTPCFEMSEHNTNAFYGGSTSPTSLWDANPNYNHGWLIRVDLTDGVYTYNLYNDGALIADNLTDTSFPTTLNDNAANRFEVKTNYYGGEVASNMIGFAKGNSTIASLDLEGDDLMTVMENASLTVSGNATNDDANRLVVENGAKLILNNDGVKATVKYNIVPFSSSNIGWYFITSPTTEGITPSVENGLLVDEYDLYYYHEPTEYWINYETEPFNFNPLQGYLYANNIETQLTYAGTLRSAASNITIDGLSHSANILKGFNLVGNPFTCNTTIDDDFFVINDDGDEIILAATGRLIKSCEAFMVKASETNDQVVFSANTSKGRQTNNSFDLFISQNQSIRDRVRIRFDEGKEMETIKINSNVNKLYIPQNDRKYSVVHSDGQTELPVCFKSATKGTYTIGIDAANLNLDYLHLIDNLTFNDIDLLTTPEYTFESKPSDYAARFRLLFAPDEEQSGSENNGFIFFANDILHINNQGEALLQIIDMTGRIISTKKIHDNYEGTLDLSSGVYVVRLSNNRQVSQQKVVIP